MRLQATKRLVKSKRKNLRAFRQEELAFMDPEFQDAVDAASKLIQSLCGQKVNPNEVDDEGGIHFELKRSIEFNPRNISLMNQFANKYDVLMIMDPENDRLLVDFYVGAS